MATPFVGLGLKVTNKLVDAHFHKLPDKYFQPENYDPTKVAKAIHPKRVVKAVIGSKGSKESASEKRDHGASDEEEDEAFSEEEVEPAEVPRMPAYRGPPPPGTHDIYSHEPPKMRSQYVPPAALAAGAAAPSYYPPPMSEPYDYGYSQRDGRGEYDRGDRSGYSKSRESRADSDRRRGRRYDDDEDGDESSYSSPKRSSRPKAVSRRSNSYPAQRSKKYYDDDSDDSRERRYDSGSRHVDRAMERGHRYKLKEEIKNNFTDSKGGLAGSAVGALVGGWAASKAQVAYDKKGKGEANPLITLLGAAIGGLAINVVADKYEEEKGQTLDEQLKFEKMFGKKEGSDRGGDRDRGSDRGGDRDRGSDRGGNRDGRSDRGGDRDRGRDRGDDRDGRRRRRSTRRDRGYDSGYD